MLNTMPTDSGDAPLTALAAAPRTRADSIGARCASDRTNNFDALRLLLALSVVFGHSYALTPAGLAAEPIDRFTHGIFYSGGVAVAFFFLISGFLITGSWLKNPSIRVFAEKRALRIVPGYVAAVVFSVLIVAAIASGLGRYQLRLLVQGAAVAPMKSPNVFPSNPFPYFLNGSLWTIRYELICYALVAVLGAMGQLTSGRTTLVATVLLALAAAADTKTHLLERLPEWIAVSNYAVFFMACFGVGMAFYIYKDRIPYSPWIGAACALGAIAISHGEHRATISILLFPFLLGYVLFIVAFSRVRIPTWNGVDLSYGTYVYAFAVQQFLAWRGVRSVALMFGLATAITLALAALSWFAIEAPALRFKRRVAGPGARPIGIVGKSAIVNM